MPATVGVGVWGIGTALLLGGLVGGCDRGCAGASLQPDARAKSRVEPVLPPTATEGLAALPLRMAASQILIAHSEADNHQATVTRSEEDARRIAVRLARQLRRAPSRFAELARRHSDSPEAGDGGYLGSWNRGRMLFPFEAAVSVLPTGGISDPVKTVFGFHIIRREPNLPAERVSASHLLVAHADALRAPPEVRRTRTDARAKAEQIAREINKNPDKLQSFIKKHSDGPRATTGGQLGVWVTTRGRRPAIFDRAVLGLEMGGISAKPVESSFGFHIFVRTSPTESPTLAASQILITHRGVKPAAMANPRTPQKARAVARRIWRRLQRAPKTFEDAARRHSEHPSADRGGHLGILPTGQVHPALEKAILALKPGQISKPVETNHGIHILRRDPVARR